MTSDLARKIIKNKWVQSDHKPYQKSEILNHNVHPEGLDVERIRFLTPGSFIPDPSMGHIISVLNGRGKIILPELNKRDLNIESEVHLYLPPRQKHILNVEAETELLKVSSPTDSQARGEKLLLRDERFLSACAAESQSLRWILTPQYLSRRIFLHNDKTLLSKSMNPVSWFRTTMFDVAGLPQNDEGDSVFKMSYNSRTEFNVCYKVKGNARVRMAKHPYGTKKQEWDRWHALDSGSTYLLDETEGGPEEECVYDDENRTKQYLRNKHEVYIVDGYVTLLCLFDPAPTGVERHKPGEYSDYEPLSNILGTKLYESHRTKIAKYDEMVDQLSIARAEGTLDQFKNSSIWQIYLKGKNSQLDLELKLHKTLDETDDVRKLIIEPWMLT